jgi:hypothetical protein
MVGMPAAISLRARATRRAVPRSSSAWDRSGSIALAVPARDYRKYTVGPYGRMADVISSGAVLVVRLNEVFRLAAQSRIITSAHRINQGSIPDLCPRGTESDFYSCKRTTWRPPPAASLNW